jgi:hypothetical protein
VPAIHLPALLFSRSVGYSVSGSSPGGVEAMSPGVLRPVVVVVEDLRVQAGRAQRGTERLDELGLLRHRHVGARVAVRMPVLRLVLHGDGVDRDAGPLVRPHELDEVARVGGVDPRSSTSRPPISDWFVFIHAGALHGDPITLSCGLNVSAWRSSGRICARSCAIEKRVIA